MALVGRVGEDLRKNVRVGVGFGVVEFQLDDAHHAASLYNVSVILVPCYRCQESLFDLISVN